MSRSESTPKALDVNYTFYPLPYIKNRIEDPGLFSYIMERRSIAGYCKKLPNLEDDQPSCDVVLGNGVGHYLLSLMNQDEGTVRFKPEIVTDGYFGSTGWISDMNANAIAEMVFDGSDRSKTMAQLQSHILRTTQLSNLALMLTMAEIIRQELPQDKPSTSRLSFGDISQVEAIMADPDIDMCMDRFDDRLSATISTWSSSALELLYAKLDETKPISPAN